MPPLEDTQAPAPAAPAPAPAATPAAAPAPADDMSFDDAFAEASGGAAPAAAPAAEAPAPAPAPPEAPAPAAAAAPAAEVPAPAPAPAAGSETEAELRRQIAQLNSQFEALRQQAPAPTPAPAAQAPAPTAAPLYAPEEQEFLTNYEKEWSDVSRAESLKRRGEYQQLAQHIFTEIAKQLIPLQQQTQVTSANVQLTEIERLVPDYEAVRDPCVEWIGKQPAWRKPAYEAVAANGTPEEVAEMIAEFKKATGWKTAAASAPAAATPPAPAPAPTQAPAPSPAHQAAARGLAPVSSARTQPTQNAPDPNDFDGAFKEFAAALTEPAK